MKIALSPFRALLAVLALVAPALHADPAIPNPSFEQNGAAFTTSPGYIQGNTTITGWTASDPTRVGINSSAGPFQDNGATPDGSYVAFVQSVGPAVTLSTTITNLTIGVTYQVQFSANRRSVYGSPLGTLAVNNGPAVAFSVEPAGYRTFTEVFTATGNTAPLVITNTADPAGFQDATLLLDNFTITAMPAGPLNFVVTNTLDTGLGSLRHAFYDASTHAGPDTITFADGLSGIIVLASEIGVVDPDGATVDASNVSLILSGGGTHRILNFNSATGSFSLHNLTFIDGSISFGGALFSDGPLTLANCTFLANTATTSGGAVYGRGPLALTNCSFSGNLATVAGGALFAQRALTVSGCTFNGNSSQGAGGAVMVSASAPFSSAFTDCTFTGNQAVNGGGAITDYLGDEVVTISHCTIANNQSSKTGSGGGLDFFKTTQATVSYTILSNNTTAGSLRNYGAQLGTAPALIANRYNLSDDAPLGFSGTDLVNTTANLGPLQNNGGPTQTMAIGPDSPAFDGAVGSTATTDQRQAPINGTPDIGAYESQAAAFSLSAATYAVAAGYPLTVTVNRSGNLSGPATVRLITGTGTAAASAFTARPDTTASDLAFADGETAKDVVIQTGKNSVPGPDKTFLLALGSPTYAHQATTRSPSTATVTIKIPVTLQVTSTNDDGPGSLRQMLATAASTPAYNVITFAPALNGKTITLGGDIVVNDAGGVTIDASALPAGVTIDGGSGGNRIFTVGNATATSLTLLHLTLINGQGESVISDFSGQGGAIYNYAGATLSLMRCTLSGNQGSFGGALMSFGARISMAQCTLSGNTSFADGGAVYGYGGTLTLHQCTLYGNTTGAGSDGGALISYNGCVTVLTQCTLSGNTGGREGGALWNSIGSFLSLSQCTVANNTTVSAQSGAGGGGGLLSTGVLTLDRSIVAGNSSAQGPKDVYCFGVTLKGACIIQDIGGSGARSGTGTILNADPMLSPLASNGGLTQTLALLPGSPAIDAATGSFFASDQRGLPLVGTADIGAFEVQKGGVFTLSQTVYDVAESSGSLIMTIRRSVGFSGPASVKVTTTPGTAGAADFTSLSQVVNFADGEIYNTVTIMLAPDSLAEPNETFKVALSTPSAGCTLGSPATALVVIVDHAYSTDTTKPATPVITSPAANAMVGVPTGGTLLLTGTASDKTGLSGVRILDSLGTFVTFATQASDGAPSTTWSALVTPVTGLNTFQAMSVNGSGINSDVVSRTFIVTRPLLVNVSGYGSVTPGYAPSSYRQVGRPQTLTATAGAGYLFTGWSIRSSHTPASIGASNLSLPVLNFVHREGLILRASFVPSPYTAANTGVFNGGIDATGLNPGLGIFPSLSNTGYVSATVKTTGAFTAALKLDGTSYPVAGVFDAGGTAHFGTLGATTFSIPRTGQPGLFVTLGINIGTGTISGTVASYNGSAVAGSASITAERCPFGPASLVPASLLGPANADATYTIIMPAIQGQALGNANYPQGSGYASMKLTKAGAVTVSGVLADGTPFSEATTLSAAQHWRLFASLYGNKGLVAGNATFGPSNYDFLALNSTWLRPVMDSQYYPGGWANGISLNVAGAKYTVTPGQSVLPGLDVAGDAELDFSAAGLSSTVKDTFTTTGADVIHNTSNDVTYKLTINRTTGMFTGFFTAPDGSMPVFNGVVLTKGLSSLSAGFFLTPAPKVKDYTGQSGNVILSATP